MSRQLVVCLDGTNNRFSNRPTNIVQILNALDRDPANVLTYYDQGVGTFGIRETLFEWQKVPSRIFGMAFGWASTDSSAAPTNFSHAPIRMAIGS
jgi:uncharacterized protein (DUF2235 family)